ncbi:MAG TPA: histidine kinase [Cyanobacteria bacterium UBA11369]|nr:histidine kinase [Cyanobacteria bacterium UBA11371]HBE34455.1 histidine kinase [Cyanobacteria bacterium UBA11368]HBE52670.1 histidine kinase [Cyanobacteria bacterium UBA11369]
MFNRQTYRAKYYSKWVKNMFSRLSIAKKIGYGYGLAIGISVLGTTMGLFVGEYYQKQAKQQHEIAHEQEYLIYDLNISVREMRSHPQRLMSVVGQSIWFDYETAKFFGDVRQVKKVISEFETFVENHPSELASNSTNLKELLKGYRTNTESYTELIRALWNKINTANLKAEEIETANQALLNFNREKQATLVSVEFERLSESLNKIKNEAERQKNQSDIKLEQAEKIRVIIIGSSMILSVGIATLLAKSTSRAIAHPLVAVTQVANATIKEANFKLRSAVTTQDEIGSLATSLNQLVEWVEEYTLALELARKTLEQRVEERTQELQQTLKELQATQTQLIQTEKMSSLGQMVAGIAHEINNPVNFIHGNLHYARQYAEDLLELVQLYQQEYPDPTPLIQAQIEAIDLNFINEDFQKILFSMKVGTERIQKIVLSLRNFSRLDEAEMKSVDIHEGIENTLLILDRRLKTGIEVVKNYGYLPPIECYPAQLNQVFMNILANAIDALEEVMISRKESPNYQLPTILIRTEINEENYITIRILDNGLGISPEIKHKLFDPFFTTKPVGKGTGLGLSICYQIVEKHGGKIEVNSEVGKGTEFAIALPIKTKSRQLAAV